MRDVARKKEYISEYSGQRERESERGAHIYTCVCVTLIFHGSVYSSSLAGPRANTITVIPLLWIGGGGARSRAHSLPSRLLSRARRLYTYNLI